MKKIGIIIFGIALLAGVVFANFFSFGKAESGLVNFSFVRGVKGSGNISTETRDIKDFRSIDVSGVFNVEIVAQKDFSVQVEADDNLIPLIKTEVNDGVLEISTEKRVKSSTRMTIRISAPDIEKIEASGATVVSLADLKNSGLTIDTSGASKIKLAGETSDLNVDVSGASKIDAENLQAIDAVVDASGASRVLVNVSRELRADCSGASSVIYSGTPSNIQKKTSGASSIAAK
jgi:hypothetical protein